MESVGDDRVVDPQAHPDTDERERGGRFDPGVETGSLRRTPREYPLSPEVGAAPFDPGPGAGYDERRAARAAKRRQRQERRALSEQRRQERELKLQERRDEMDRAAAGVASLEAALQSLSEPEPVPTEPAPDEQPPAPVDELSPRRESLAERLERERIEREQEEHERRERIEGERAERERAERERVEHRRRERAEKLRRERAALRRPPAASPAARPSRPARPTRAARPRAKPASEPAQIRPGVKGPVRKRARAAENRRRAAATRRGLFWPTAKAGLAVTLVLALGLGLGSALGLPVPGLDARAGNESLASSASLFGVDAGTPQGLAPGYVFPLQGPHDFGDKEARFGASRYGHVHEGQDIFGKTGTPEVAVHDGVVVDRGKNSDPDDGGRGNYIALYSPADNHSFVYMHMLTPSSVHLGQQVHAGQVVGRLGCTGSCDGPHLHFEVRIGKASLGAETKAVDPLPYLQQWPQPTPG
jgi:murein DD-endopeptidase MepM/ murein hydrolase activator NlpD